MKVKKFFKFFILGVFTLIVLLAFYQLQASEFESAPLSSASDLNLNKNLVEVITQVLKKTEQYMNTSKEADKRVLLEAYGFALGLSQNIGDSILKEAIEKKILKSLKEFAYEDLRLVKDIELSNLASNLKGFKEAFENIRLQFKIDNHPKELPKSLAILDDSFKKAIVEIFDYLHGMLGGPPLNSNYVIVSIGSLATRMTTPYSDIEYIILIDHNTDENRIYFNNFADLFELLMIGFGESPIYKAESFLTEFKSYFKYIKRGNRIDEHKRPQDINHLYGLINTSEELLGKIPIRIIHEPGNHLTSALLTTGYLAGDLKLYNRFEALFQKALPTAEYLHCLRKLLQEDIRSSNGFQKQLQNSFLRKEFKKEIEIKEILIHGIHLARSLAIFLRSTGEDIVLKTNFFEIIEELKKGGYINQEQYQHWYHFVNTLFLLRLELQMKNQSAEAKLTLNKLHQELDILTITQQLREITNIIEEQLEKRRNIQHSVSIKNFTKSPLVWNLPRQDHWFVGRKQLLEELQEKLHPKSMLQLTLQENKEESEGTGNELSVVSVCAGMGGVGKTQLALQYIHHSKYPYTLKAWFQAENLDQLKQQTIEFAKMLGYREREPSIETALPYLKKWLTQHPGWLLVYDNVNAYEEIKEFLPTSGGSVLLTSRQRNWPNRFDILDVEVMNEEESIELIQSLIQRKILETERQEVKELVKTLGYLPLALAQAGAYIRESSIAFSDYLKLYKGHEQELLADTALPEGTKSLPVAATWNISLEAIVKVAKAKNESPLALHLLTACAYLAPEKIPRHFLLTWLKDNYPNLTSPELALPKLIGQLWQYSMIKKEENGDITMHRLVQAVIRYQHMQALGMKNSSYLPLTLEWYSKLLGSTHHEFSHKAQVLEDESRRKNLLPHLQALLNHYKQMWPDASELCLVPILNNIGTALLLIGEPGNAKAYYERALPIVEQFYGKAHPKVTETLINLGRTYRALGRAKQAKGLCGRALSIVEQYYGRSNFKAAGPLECLGNVYRDLGNFRQATEIHERVLRIKEQYYGRDHVEIADTLDSLGRDYRYLGEAKKAIEFHERALKIKEQYYGKDHVTVALTLDHLGRNYRYIRNTKQAKKLHERALKIKKQYYGKDKEHVEIALTLDHLGRDYRDLGEFKQATDLHESVLKIKEQYYGENHIEIAFTLDQLGRDYRNLGEFKKAKELHEHALKIKEQYYGKDHVEVADTLDYLGRDYRSLGEAKKAKELHERALKFKEQYYGKDHVEVSYTLDHLSRDCRDLGEFKKAKELHERVLKSREQYYGKDHIIVVFTLDHLARDYRNLGEVKKAKELHEYVLKFKEQYYGKDHIEVASALDQLGRDCRYLGEVKKAKEFHERALKIKEQNYDKNHLQIAESFINLGNAYIALNNAKQGKMYLEQALTIKVSYYGTDHPKIAEVLIDLSHAYNALGDFNQSKIQLDHALEIRGKYFGQSHPFTMEIMKTIVQLGIANP